jgi:hypothetical protein
MGAAALAVEAVLASAEASRASADAVADGSGALTRTDAFAGRSAEGADELGARAPSAQASTRVVVKRRALRCISGWSLAGTRV